MPPRTIHETTVGVTDSPPPSAQLVAMNVEVARPRYAPVASSASPSALDLFQLASALALALLFRRLRA
jgi:hypothetical protein